MDKFSIGRRTHRIQNKEQKKDCQLALYRRVGCRLACPVSSETQTQLVQATGMSMSQQNTNWVDDNSLNLGN